MATFVREAKRPTPDLRSRTLTAPGTDSSKRYRLVKERRLELALMPIFCSRIRYVSYNLRERVVDVERKPSMRPLTIK
eukprot:1806523-Karenia_brevis.AAC.1